MGIFVYAFTATGKSTCGKKYKNVIDMESTCYKYLNCNEVNEADKGKSNRKINPKWPQNYFDALESAKNNYDYVLISDTICDTFLQSKEYEYWWVYPNINLKKEYLERCKKRGNNRSFIYWYNKLWKKWINDCINDKKASKFIELKSGEFLEDVLPNLKLK